MQAKNDLLAEGHAYPANAYYPTGTQRNDGVICLQSRMSLEVILIHSERSRLGRSGAPEFRARGPGPRARGPGLGARAWGPGPVAGARGPGTGARGPWPGRKARGSYVHIGPGPGKDLKFLDQR